MAGTITLQDWEINMLRELVTMLSRVNLMPLPEKPGAADISKVSLIAGIAVGNLPLIKLIVDRLETPKAEIVLPPKGEKNNEIPKPVATSKGDASERHTIKVITEPVRRDDSEKPVVVVSEAEDTESSDSNRDFNLTLEEAAEYLRNSGIKSANRKTIANAIARKILLSTKVGKLLYVRRYDMNRVIAHQIKGAAFIDWSVLED